VAIGLALAGCQLPIAGQSIRDALYGIASSPAPSGSATAGQTAVGNGGQTAINGSFNPGGASPAPNPLPTPTAPPFAGALSGNVLRPSGDLIANNSGGLIGTGGAVFFRLLGLLEQTPVVGAIVTLERLDGTALTDATGTTNDFGRFAFAALPQIDGAFVAKATFQLSGKPIVFRSLVPGVASTSIDVASTLVAAKVQQLAHAGQIDPRAIAPPQVDPLLALLRGRLQPGVLPFMGGPAAGPPPPWGPAPDLLPTFDQLVLDDPDIRARALDLAPALATPWDAWQVDTVLTSRDMVGLGLIPPFAPPEAQLFGPAGTFAVDPDGNIYFPVLPPRGYGVKIFKVVPGSPGHPATGTSYADLPANYLNPVSLAFSPQGVLHALAVEAGSFEARVFRGAGVMEQLPGAVFQLSFSGGPPGTDPDGVDSRVLGRIAVDATGSVYVAFPFAHTINILQAGADEGQVLAGTANAPGFVDDKGAAARFRFPFSVAIGPGGYAYVADKDNHLIRRVATDGTTITVAGSADDALDYRNGRGGFARFGGPESITFDASGSLYLTDIVSRRVRRISPDGSVFLVAGTGDRARVNGAGPAASFYFPRFLTTDGKGSLYLLDQDPDPPPGSPPPLEYIRRISRRSPP